MVGNPGLSLQLHGNAGGFLDFSSAASVSTVQGQGQGQGGMGGVTWRSHSSTVSADGVSYKKLRQEEHGTVEGSHQETEMRVTQGDSGRSWASMGSFGITLPPQISSSASIRALSGANEIPLPSITHPHSSLALLSSIGAAVSPKKQQSSTLSPVAALRQPQPPHFPYHPNVPIALPRVPEQEEVRREWVCKMFFCLYYHNEPTRLSALSSFLQAHHPGKGKISKQQDPDKDARPFFPQLKGASWALTYERVKFTVKALLKSQRGNGRNLVHCRPLTGSATLTYRPLLVSDSQERETGTQWGETDRGRISNDTESGLIGPPAKRSRDGASKERTQMKQLLLSDA
uniref:Uncharacterized protein n=1 Tax=Chromera velia CCMP2878 TaxID=1169474 RepID=A0A0G4H536_9ALVE|eukprot:Cvel_24713.t1-p1 / transcript=Cvel_24713.t1 / gene=Cvel_24713 / organism=Chromera_velia_CCMP2878 / gene_product=hypothetical protein / transcript_product=hypothetical protein / location=Cvel_scaffold2711:16669-19298(-) / protein_length=343 / sequence_SO=supercontig / SO=protein_coding / is_pseudo=false